ncbi:hypothetical protein BGW39_002674 [Mortierella sp. 14UC]|nr:hypothetical protein BGW39_002674 [Mortierella sp. 14UC]
MRSPTAILFAAAVAALAFTSAAPTPAILKVRELTTENQQCKEPIQKIYDHCVGHGQDAGCQALYITGNKACDDEFPYSVAPVVADAPGVGAPDN